MLRTLDNLAVGSEQPSTNLPYGVINRGVGRFSTSATRPSNMMGSAMGALQNLVMGDVRFPPGGYGNVPQSYVANAALNYTEYATVLKGGSPLPSPGTMAFAIQDIESERTAVSNLALYTTGAHSTQYPGHANRINKVAHPMSTPEGLNYYLLERQLKKFNEDIAKGAPQPPSSPLEVADMFSLDGVCISMLEISNHATLTLTWQGRANFVNNTGIDNLVSAAKIYIVFKRTKNKHIPREFLVSPHMSSAEKRSVRKSVVGLEVAGDEFTPVLAYPVVLCDGSRITAEYLVDDFGNADSAVFYLGHVFKHENYTTYSNASGRGKNTDPANMRPFADAGNPHTRGLIEVNVELKRVR